MAELCQNTPVPIALDEELIGIFVGSGEWIKLAEQHNMGWWVTSALESNIGLNAIAQWTYTLQNNRPQGLGTGSLYTNNFDSPLEVSEGKLYYRAGKNWEFDLIEKLCT